MGPFGHMFLYVHKNGKIRDRRTRPHPTAQTQLRDFWKVCGIAGPAPQSGFRTHQCSLRKAPLGLRPHNLSLPDAPQNRSRTPRSGPSGLPVSLLQDRTAAGDTSRCGVVSRRGAACFSVGTVCLCTRGDVGNSTVTERAGAGAATGCVSRGRSGLPGRLCPTHHGVAAPRRPCHCGLCQHSAGASVQPHPWKHKEPEAG